MILYLKWVSNRLFIRCLNMNQIHINPMTPMIDQHLISHYNTNPKSHSHKGHKNNGKDLQLKKLLIVKQILPVSTTRNGERTEWRFYNYLFQGVKGYFRSTYSIARKMINSDNGLEIDFELTARIYMYNVFKISPVCKPFRYSSKIQINQCFYLPDKLENDENLSPI